MKERITIEGPDGAFAAEHGSNRLVSLAAWRPFSWLAFDVAGGMTYSYLSATKGPTFIARRAGM